MQRVLCKGIFIFIKKNSGHFLSFLLRSKIFPNFWLKIFLKLNKNIEAYSGYLLQVHSSKDIELSDKKITNY